MDTKTSANYTIIRDGKGWHGSNAFPKLYGKALSQSIRLALKKQRIGNVSVSVSVSSGEQMVSIKCKTTKKDFVSFEDYLSSKMDDVNFATFTGKLLHEGEVYLGKWIEIDSLSEDEQISVYQECCTERYKSLTSRSVLIRDFHEYADIISASLLEKLDVVKSIVDSYNYNHSDAKSDYYDVGFYTEYRLIA